MLTVLGWALHVGEVHFSSTLGLLSISLPPGYCFHPYVNEHLILGPKGSHFRQREKEKEEGNTCHFIARISPRLETPVVPIYTRWPARSHIATSGANEAEKECFHFSQIQYLSSIMNKRLEFGLQTFTWNEKKEQILLKFWETAFRITSSNIFFILHQPLQLLLLKC